MKPAIRVEHLSKQYRIGTRSADSYRTLRESVMQAVTGPLRRLRQGGPAPARQDTFWALKDVSFDVQPGQAVGIIGHNGAGKSTLLKILSQISEPTQGRVTIQGRVGSLLEVGTGFHQELSGRENIYLSAAILGMGRREIDRRFDDIVAFAEVERFLDLPVKRYSSGMYVRLAFAVAAHLDYEVLLIDEVLAVGDATYQRKCLDRMVALIHGGRTVLFVSHNMDVIPRLCRHAILLEQGRVAEVGDSQPVIDGYLARALSQCGSSDLSGVNRIGDGRARFSRVAVVSVNGEVTGTHRSGDNLAVRAEIASSCDIPDAALAINLRTLTGTKIHSAWTREQNVPISLRRGRQTWQCTFQNVRLRPGFTFDVELWIESGTVMDHIPSAVKLLILDSDSSAGYAASRDQGVVLTEVKWTPA